MHHICSLLTTKSPLGSGEIISQTKLERGCMSSTTHPRFSCRALQLTASNNKIPFSWWFLNINSKKMSEWDVHSVLPIPRFFTMHHICSLLTTKFFSDKRSSAAANNQTANGTYVKYYPSAVFLSSVAANPLSSQNTSSVVVKKHSKLSPNGGGVNSYLFVVLFGWEKREGCPTS